MEKSKKQDLVAAASAARNTDSGPAKTAPPGQADRATEKAVQSNALAASFPSNIDKMQEHGLKSAVRQLPGNHAHPILPYATASTLTELHDSAKAGGPAREGFNSTVGALDRMRSDATDQVLTTNQGVAVADNQNSLKAGLRGPVLLEDFILREKITHFDHERIPERVVHARGSGAHGLFECTEAIPELTRAAPFQRVGKTTPVFVRFSTVAGERGSKDTARDVRGFAVKFYTSEGNWDLVGNNMPVFFIQDAMKFPDLVHAVKPEPHHQIPQAASAHDTFWDFVSLMPESTHMLMWLMSDRAIPRSYATMQGFGVHTFRFVNADGNWSFVKFHWLPVAGTHSLVWDEAVKISGADPDFHRRDLWERIESGAYPQYELAIQVFSEEQAAQFSFDVLDATKIIPEELVPLRIVGRMTLLRNPDNFFSETEQVAFCTAHVIPGIDFSNDPLLAGRIHSYVDTQISRLGGPNFHELPINAPMAQVHNNQRDGMHRQAIHRGKVSYEPNSLAGGCPFQAGAMQGFVTVPTRERAEDQQPKVRAKPEKFADHYTQARLFLDSQTEPERAHMAAAFRFELSKLTVPAIRERMLASLRNVCEQFAASVAAGLGVDPMPEPMPRALEDAPTPEVSESAYLSLLARPGDGGIEGRKIGIFVVPGGDGDLPKRVQAEILKAGGIGRFIGPRIGPMLMEDEVQIDADTSTENTPGFLFDALVVSQSLNTLADLDYRFIEFIQDSYAHRKPILIVIKDDSDKSLLAAVRNYDPEITFDGTAKGIKDFIGAVGKPRNFVVKEQMT